jgi:hypothetical protein
MPHCGNWDRAQCVTQYTIFKILKKRGGGYIGKFDAGKWPFERERHPPNNASARRRERPEARNKHCRAFRMTMPRPGYIFLGIETTYLRVWNKRWRQVSVAVLALRTHEPAYTAVFRRGTLK